MAYQLVMKTGPAPGKIYSLENSEISVGREVGSDVFVNEVEVSRRHARLTLQAGSYILEDLGSTNGTFVNGERVVGQRILRPGDTITLGENVSLTFESTAFDPNATQVSVASTVIEEQPPEFVTPTPEEVQKSTPAPAPQPIYSAPSQEPYIPEEEKVPPPPPPLQPEYAGYPVEPLVPEESRSNRTLWWAGCGCAVVLVCILVGGAFVFDYLNLYCTPPFREAMVLIGAACP
jgi:pSer/pThr/pTyr-binding forkhead associated (FHA) protein